MDLFGHVDEPAEDELDDTPPALAAFADETDATADISPYTGPRFNLSCHGHAEIETMLLDLFNSGRFPHGLIFAGPKGIGKATMAFRLARFLLTGGGQGAPQTLDVPAGAPVIRQVRAQAHPDLLVLERAYDDAKDRLRAALDVDELRKVAPFLRLTASGGAWRVVIIDDADTMNRNAQNALLKILEEPPPRTVLILIAHRPSALISTIKSRTLTVPFRPLSKEILRDLLRQARPELSAHALEDILELADGSLGKAINDADNKADDIYGALMDILATYNQMPDWPAVHRMADQLGFASGDKAYEIFEETVLRMLSANCRLKATGQAPEHQIFDSWGLIRFLETLDKVHDVFEKTKFSNLDKRQAVIGVFSLLLGA